MTEWSPFDRYTSVIWGSIQEAASGSLMLLQKSINVCGGTWCRHTDAL